MHAARSARAPAGGHLEADAPAVAVDRRGADPAPRLEPVEQPAERRAAHGGPLGDPAGPLGRRRHDDEHAELRQRHVVEGPLEQPGAGRQGPRRRHEIVLRAGIVRATSLGYRTTEQERREVRLLASRRIDYFVDAVIRGVEVGSVYAMVGLGLAVIFTSTGVFNFAQGDVVAVGALLALDLWRRMGWTFRLALLGVAVVGAALGAATELVAVRPVRRQRQSSIRGSSRPSPCPSSSRPGPATTCGPGRSRPTSPGAPSPSGRSCSCRSASSCSRSPSP